MGGFDVCWGCFFSFFWAEKKEALQLEDDVRSLIWVFPKIGVPQNGWFIMKIPIRMDDLGALPYFWKHQFFLQMFLFFLHFQCCKNCVKMGPTDLEEG